MENNRNLILAMVLSVAVLFGWQAFVIAPREADETARIEAEQARLEASRPQTPTVAGQPVPGAVPGSPATPGTIPTVAPTAELPREQALQAAPRVPLLSGRLEGSINLRGARIDDLKLLDYRETVSDTSPFIELLSPEGTRDGYFSEFGYAPDPRLGDLPGPQTLWTAAEGQALSATQPVTLTYTNDRGLTFERTIALDDFYMFTVTDRVTNASGEAVSLRPYGRIARYGTPATEGIYVLHEGLIGSVGENGLDEIDYDDVQEARTQYTGQTSGWLGITDKYWATALIPNAGGAASAIEGSAIGAAARTFDANYTYARGVRPFYETSFVSAPVVVADGATAETSARLFAGRQEGGHHRRLRGATGHRAVLQPHRLGLVLLPDQADVPADGLVLRPCRQFRRGHPAHHRRHQGGVLSARQQVLQVDGEHEARRSADDGDPREVRRRPAGPAEGHDGALQDREDQPGRGLSAGAHPDPGLLRALQGALRHDRHAPRAVLRLDPRPFGARSDLDLQPVRSAALTTCRCSS